MKQNITLALDQDILKAVRAYAAQQGTSVSAMLADDLRMKLAQQRCYEHSKRIALVMLDQGWSLGGQGVNDRGALHDRPVLR